MRYAVCASCVLVRKLVPESADCITELPCMGQHLVYVVWSNRRFSHRSLPSPQKLKANPVSMWLASHVVRAHAAYIHPVPSCHVSPKTVECVTDGFKEPDWLPFLHGILNLAGGTLANIAPDIQHQNLISKVNLP